jgi:signal transduction histidine kinase
MVETRKQRQFLRFTRAFFAPVVLWALFVGILVDAFQTRLQGNEEYDRAALKEWVDESRAFRQTLPELAREYLAGNSAAGSPDALVRTLEIRDQLKALADPTKMYAGQLPLFPTIYRLELRFPEATALAPIVWESGLPRPGQNRQVRQLEHRLLGSDDPRAVLVMEYQLHAYNKRQRDEQVTANRLRWVLGLATAATALAFLWLYLVQRGEQSRGRQRLLAQQQLDSAERLALQHELRRQEAERRHEDVERKLLEQRLATQSAERQALELRSQLYASIGIMAGSYAHNIKNLLVRPNDLLQRCLAGDSLSSEQSQMLHEVRQTLGIVTERLQEILKTVRRDPSRSEMKRLDLRRVVEEICTGWDELAGEKWKLTIATELAGEPLWVEGDQSHLQQAVENLLFNARDATFEMRNLLRDEARREPDLAQQRRALIAAAGWKGAVTLRAWRQGQEAVLEVRDNGIGMTDEVRRRCTETHFSTKRDNAIYEGNSTGMGLGLSFVAAILEHHRARLEIESAIRAGASFRIVFPLAGGDELA